MYLEKINIKNFKSFDDVEVIFIQGLNILVGKNSSGKSTILEAINALSSSNIENINRKIRNPDLKKIEIIGDYVLDVDEALELSSEILELKDVSIENKIKVIKRYHCVLTGGTFIQRSQVISLILDGNEIGGLNWDKLELLNHIIKLRSIPLPVCFHLEKTNAIGDLQAELHRNNNTSYSYIKAFVQNEKKNNKNSYNDKIGMIKDFYHKFDSNVQKIDIDYFPDYSIIDLEIFENDRTRFCADEGMGIQEYFYILLAIKFMEKHLIIKDESFNTMHIKLLENFIESYEQLSSSAVQMIVASHNIDLIKRVNRENLIYVKINDDISKKTIQKIKTTQEVNKLYSELVGVESNIEDYEIDIDSIFSEALSQ